MGTSCNPGCDGGYIDQTYIYLGEEGTVGGSCKSYVGEDETCSDFVCDSGETTNTTFYAKGINAFGSSLMNMKAFTVYQDFYDYDGGVYDTQSGMEKGGHAIRVLGWGVEGGMFRVSSSLQPLSCILLSPTSSFVLNLQGKPYW
ncbi:hypothetical protein QOT17_000846 [Balamuthia mandrillaris]